MADFLGMDVEAASSTAGNVKTFANELNGIFDGALSAVQGADWVGPDADAYKQNFQSSITSALDGFAGVVNALATELEQDVQEQEAASQG